MRNSLDIQHAAERIGRPVSTWAGDCHGIAMLLCAALLQDEVISEPGLRLARGHWNGTVHPRSYFRNRAGMFIPHSWLVTEAGTLIDPTRFAFENPNQEPYIYVGKTSDEGYDEGGNQLRALRLGDPPNYSPSDAILGLKLDGKAGHWVAQATGFQYPTGIVTWPLAMWLANLPVPLMGEHARPIFEYLERAGKRALIPWDNRVMVLGR